MSNLQKELWSYLTMFEVSRDVKFRFRTFALSIDEEHPWGGGWLDHQAMCSLTYCTNRFLFIPWGGIEVGLFYGQGKPLGREHADGGTTREEGRDEVGRGAQGELKVGVLGGGA